MLILYDLGGENATVFIAFLRILHPFSAQNCPEIISGYSARRNPCALSRYFQAIKRRLEVCPAPRSAHTVYAHHLKTRETRRPHAREGWPGAIPRFARVQIRRPRALAGVPLPASLLATWARGRDFLHLKAQEHHTIPRYAFLAQSTFTASNVRSNPTKPVCIILPLWSSEIWTPHQRRLSDAARGRASTHTPAGGRSRPALRLQRRGRGFVPPASERLYEASAGP